MAELTDLSDGGGPLPVPALDANGTYIPTPRTPRSWTTAYDNPVSTINGQGLDALLHTGLTGAIRSYLAPDQSPGEGYKPEQVAGPNGTYRYVNAQGERFYEKPISEEQRNASNVSDQFFQGLVGGPEISAAEHAFGAIGGLLGNKIAGGAEAALRPSVPAFASSGEREASVQAAAAARRAAEQKLTPILVDKNAKFGWGIADESGKLVSDRRFNSNDAAQGVIGRDFTPTSAPTPTQSEVNSVFGDVNQARVEASVTHIPEDFMSKLRKAERGEGEFPTTEETQAAFDSALGSQGALANDANREALAQLAASEVVKTNNITSALGLTTRKARTTGPTAEQLANEQAIREGTASPSDVIPTTDQIVSKAEEDALWGGSRVPPSDGNPPTINPPGIPPSKPPIPIPENPNHNVLGDVAREIFGLPRAIGVAGHLGILRQMLPGLTESVAMGKPGIAIGALGDMAKALKQTPMDFSTMRAGWRDALEAKGFGRGDVFLPDPSGGIGAVEESMLGHFPQNIPIAGVPFQRLQQAYAAGIGSLRTNLALVYADQVKNIGLVERGTGKVLNPFQIAERVNVLTGRGNLPFNLDNSDVAREVSIALTGVFFGPRLMTSTFQQAADTIISGGKIIAQLKAGKPVNPVDIAAVRSTLAFVSFGVGAMKLAQLAGFPIGTNVWNNDWGTITLPDGAKVDLWGGYRTTARMVAQEIGAINERTAHIGGAQPQKGSFAPTTDSIFGSWLRNKLNPPVGVINDYRVGSTAIGEPPSLDPLNPLNSPPFALDTAKYAFGSGDPHTPPGPGGLLGAVETALTEAGAGVQAPALAPKRDGLGRIDTGALPATPVTDAWANAQVTDPSLGNLTPPSRNVNTGGKTTITLDDSEVDRLRVITGNSRQTILSQVVGSPKFQSSSHDDQVKLLVGAKTEADRQAKVAFSLERAAGAKNDIERAIGARIGEAATSSDTGLRLDFLTKLQSQGSLTDPVKNAINDLRTQADPLKANYQPTVDQYLKGADLVGRYLKSPAYLGGTTPEDWTDIGKQGTRLRSVYATLEREANQASTPTRTVSVQQLPDYQQYLKDWSTVRTTSGKPISAFIQRDATVNPNMVGLERRTIEKDPLFSTFRSVATKRDPYSVKQAP